MSETKTKLNDAPVADFLNAIADEQVRQDCWKIIELMQAAAKAPPQMWGSSIIGFGTHPIRYASGKLEDWPLIAFAPRKQNLTIYNMSGFEQAEELRAQLGKHSAKGGCLYIKRLAEVDLATLEKLIQASVASRAGSPPR